MKASHSGFVKVLTVLICIGAIAAGMISLQRNHVETAARTVEMVYDYNNIIDSASVEKKTPDELFSLYKQSGITSLAVYAVGSTNVERVAALLYGLDDIL